VTSGAGVSAARVVQHPQTVVHEPCDGRFIEQAEASPAATQVATIAEKAISSRRVP
jgi:hypothetical protein